MLPNKLDSHFLQYLIDHQHLSGDRLPTLNDMSQELGISIGKLREQLEVARILGMVSVRPKVGILREPFHFANVILPGVLFGLGTGEAEFAHLSQLRRALESSLWFEAVALLTPQDKAELQALVAKAQEKLQGEPVQLPNSEHRQLHLKIFSHLANPFVQGLLETYWEAYEVSQLTRYVSYQYWLDVWDYHERIVNALLTNDFVLGQQLLVEHFALLPKVNKPQGVAPQGVAPQGVAPQGVAPQGVAPQGVAPQGVAPQNMASNGTHTEVLPQTPLSAPLE